MLKPDKNIQKYLISSPCHFVGEYETEQFRLDLAFPSPKNSYKRWDSIQQNPYSNNFLLILFKSDENRKGNEITNFDNIFAKRMSTLMAIFYGKSINMHGFLEWDGNFWAPDISNIFPNRYNFIAPFNQFPRKDVGDLTSSSSNEPCLDRIDRLVPLVKNIHCNSEFNNILFTAGNFYLHSLQSLNNDLEIAYLDLILCGEVLSNYRFFSTNYKDQSISNQFIKTLTSLLNDYYFKNDIDDLPQGKYLNRISKDNAEQAIKYSYSIRNKYLHSGRPFGQYMRPFRNMISEIRVGEVDIHVGDSDFRKAVNNALTFVGLERLIRFCLLRFIQKFGDVHLDDRLNDA